jgi:hypothetical protein
MNGDNGILGEYADQGYWVKEYDDHIVTVGYKDKEIAAFSQIGTTPEMLRDACKRHMVQLTNPVGAADL